MNKQDFLARCETAFDMGLVSPERLRLLETWCDAAMRAGAVACGVRQQADYLVDFLDVERHRLSTSLSDGRPMTLAADVDGYSLIRLAAVLGHKCQKCATDPDAWHTRSAFCQHKEVQPKF